jgi:hypothetical protein
MAITSETLRLLITGDSEGAVKAFKKAGDAADRDLGKAEDKAAKTSAQLTKMGAASLAAGAVMVAALASTIKPASDLNEAINVVGLTFGDSKDEIVEWGKNAASSTGLAASAALSGAAAIGGLLNNVGFLQDESTELSKDLVTLAADMGSAFNMSTVDALEAIRSGLAGEAEPLKRFNVFLSEAAVNAKAMELGLSDGTAALSEHEKAQARLAIIMEQTTAIQGDFANTNGDAANAAKVAAAEFENMKATLGTELLPIVTEVLGAINGLLGAFNGLPPGIKSVIGQTALWTTGLLLMGGTILTTIGRVKDLKTSLGSLNTIKLGAAGVAISELAMVVNAFVQDGAQNEQRIGSMADAIAELGEVDGLVRRFEEIGQSGEGLANILKKLDEGGFQAIANAMAEGASNNDMIDLLKDLGLNGQQATMVWQRFREEYSGAMDELDKRDSIKMAGLESNRAAEEIRMLGNRARGAGDAVRDNLNPALSEAKVPVEDLESALADLNSELDELFGSIQSAEELEADFQKALDDVTTSIETNGKAIGTQTDAQRANLDARGDVIQSINDTVQAMIDEGASSDDIVRKSRDMIKAYEDTLVAAGLTREEAEEYTAVLDGIPAEIRSELELSNYDTAIARAQYYKDLIDQIPRQVDTFVNLYGPGSASAGGSGGGGTTTAEEAGLADDWQPSDGERSSRGMKRSKRSGDGGSTEMTVVVEMDGRELARAVERVSERDGGLRVKVRGGQ